MTRKQEDFLNRAIIGAVLVLLMVVAASCDDAQPETAAQPTISSPGSTASATLTPTETPILVSVDTDASAATVGEPPFPGLEKLVASSDYSVIGHVEEISELQTTPRRDDPTSLVAYYEASVKVDHVIFGFHYDRVDVHVAVHYLKDNDRRIPAYAPPLEPGETVLLFLTRDESLFGPDDTKLVIIDGDEAWGKLAVRDGRVTTLHPAVESQPLDEVTAWIEAARFSLAKPGTLTGEVSGLDEGDHAIIRLLDLGHSERVEDGVLVTEWTAGNGPWEQGGLRLSQGNYALVAEAEGYIHASWPLGLVFEVPAEGMNWRQANIGVGLLRPEEADKVTSTGGVWRPGRSVEGRIAGIPDEVDAKVRIQRLPRVPNEVYAIGPPLPKETELYIPLELTCLEEIGHLEPEETVAVVEVHNGRWGLSDSGLSGKRHLITIEAPGLRVKPAGYVAVVFAGIADHQVWNVDFYVGDSREPYCDSDSGIVEPATPSPTPEPPPTGSTARATDHVRIDFNDGIVVAFADDSSLGRIAYVTHVPSGTQAVLDAEGTVIERHDSPGSDGGLLDVVLGDVDAMARIQEGLRYERPLPGDSIGDWYIDFIRFDGVSYYTKWRMEGATLTPERLDESQLGPVLYRVAFSLDANQLPIGYQMQDGDAVGLRPGTAIHSVIGYDPSQRLAALVNGKALLYERPGPADTPFPRATPTPMPMPTVERDRAEEPPQGPGVEIGTGYPYTLYVHCGIRDARFDGRLWMADPMLSDGSGNPPLDWTPDDSVGIMKLVRDDLAVFTARSGRIVGFKPWPLDVEWRPCA